jgi:hypothetical protein
MFTIESYWLRSFVMNLNQQLMVQYALPTDTHTSEVSVLVVAVVVATAATFTLF